MSIIKALVLPPASLMLLGLLGALLWRRRPALGKTLVALSVVALAGLSLPLVGNALLRGMEDTPPLTADRYDNDAGAIVVIGSGLYLGAPEYGGDTVGGGSLTRVRYAAHLQKGTGLPVLVSGGSPQGTRYSEAWHMKRALEDEFGVPVEWIEERSRNTWENASFSREILDPATIRTIYLVTHVLHMPRAREAFEASGFTVVPAPTGFRPRDRLAAPDFIPQASGLSRSRDALHEWLGRLWYRLRYQAGG
jgi:uncharacterized SAM-binding protein YcdF (DUF218 family)